MGLGSFIICSPSLYTWSRLFNFLFCFGGGDEGDGDGSTRIGADCESWDCGEGIVDDGGDGFLGGGGEVLESGCLLAVVLILVNFFIGEGAGLDERGGVGLEVW